MRDLSLIRSEAVMRAPRPQTALSWWCTLGLVLALVSSAQAAPARFSGPYVASPAHVEATVTEWGPDCGPRPQSYTAKDSAHLEVREQDGQLSLIFAQRTLRTNACWSPNPTVKLAKSSAVNGRWSTECRTPKDEPRKESGRYTVTAQAGAALELMEESDYDWRLEASHCVAKVRITQRLERRTAANSKLVGAQEPEPACVPGPVTRIRLRPAEAKLVPGERVCFQVRPSDAEGCAGELDESTIRWELKKQAAARATLAAGCFKAAEAAADAEGTFHVSAVSGDMRAEAVVTVEAADLSDITARRSAGAKLQGTDPQPVAGELAGAGVKAVGVEQRLRWGPFALLAALALALAAGASVWWVRRQRRLAAAQAAARSALSKLEVRIPVPVAAPRAAPQADPQLVTQLGDSGLAGAPPPEPILPSSPPQAPDPREGALICPTCRRGYAPGSTRCTTDGTALMLYADYVRRAKEQKSVVCGNCGAKLDAGAAFCGECGKKLGS